MTIDWEWSVRPGVEDSPGEIDCLYCEVIERYCPEPGTPLTEELIEFFEYAENAMMITHSPSKFPPRESWESWMADGLKLMGWTDAEWQIRKMVISVAAKEADLERSIR